MLSAIVIATIESYARYALIPLLLAGAVAAYIYIPLVGKFMAIGLCSAAAALLSYQLGYNNRANLDHSLALQAELSATEAQLKQVQSDLKTNKDIAEAANAREQVASQNAVDLQSKVSDYEKQLADEANNAGVPLVVHDTKTITIPSSCPPVRSNNRCILTLDDVTGLRGITNRRTSPH